jgi:hypothetical protein
MATNAELYGVIQPKGDVVGRVLVGLIKKAWLVLAEDAETANHANRLALAKKVILSPESVDGPAWRLFLSNATAQANLGDLSALTDSDIDWVMGDDETSKVYDLLANLEAA